MEICGGPLTPGIGFAIGLERLLMVMENQGIEFTAPRSTDIFIATIGDKAQIMPKSWCMI